MRICTHSVLSLRPRLNMRSRLTPANPHCKPTRLVRSYTRKSEFSAEHCLYYLANKKRFMEL